jgi:hypothetical protein
MQVKLAAEAPEGSLDCSITPGIDKVERFPVIYPHFILPNEYKGVESHSD